MRIQKDQATRRKGRQLCCQRRSKHLEMRSNCRTRELSVAVGNGMVLLGTVVAILFTIVCCFATNGLYLPLF